MGYSPWGRKELNTTVRLSAQGEQKWQEPVKTASGLQFEVKGSQLPGGCGPCDPDLSFSTPLLFLCKLTVCKFPCQTQSDGLY